MPIRKSSTDPRSLLAAKLARLYPQHAPAATRRRFLTGASTALFGATLAMPALLRAASVPPTVPFTADPFTLGVASGYPLADRVVLWTRLAPEPMNDGGIAAERLNVVWELARDEGFKDIVRQGRVTSHSELGHSVHVEPTGLEPDRVYYYRFHSADASSVIGRTRTAPAAGRRVDRLKLALASCQHYEQGWFSGWRHMLADQPDLVVFVGDYIYEGSWGSNPVRLHRGGEARTVVDYRNRYAQYKLDADLRAAHAALPFVLTWDDHEVDNDYAGAQSEQLDPQFLLRRAAAYQACYEHQPLPRRMLPAGADMRIYTTFDYGDLARILLLDNRQYRDPQACQEDNVGGSRSVGDCAEMAQPGRTLLGAAQQQWLEGELAQTRARWNVLAQQTLFASQRQSAGVQPERWTDAWDGYPHAREAVLAALQRHRVRNPLVLGGDVHAFYACDVHRDGDDPRTPIVASEICTTSLASEGLPRELVAGWVSHNPHIHLARPDVRGYALLELGRDAAVADLRTLDDVRRRDSTIRSLQRYRTTDGRPGWKTA